MGDSSAIYDYPPSVNALYDEPESSYFSPPTINDYIADDYDNRPYCRSLYDFEGQFDNELSFSAGEILYLTRRVNEEWLEGESQSNGVIGIFPLGFVEIVVDLPLDDASSKVEQSFQSAPASGVDNPNSIGSAEVAAIGIGSVLHDFNARYADELSVRADDTVRIIQLVDENWARCQNVATGACGIIPQSFLQIFLADDEEDTRSTTAMSPLTVTSPTSASVSSEVSNFATSKASMTTSGDRPLSYPERQNFSHSPLPLPLPLNSLPVDFFEINVATKEIKREQPPRPPPPKAEQRPQNMTLPLTSINKSISMVERVRQVPIHTKTIANTNGKGAGELKTKVVQDLLTTEMIYAFDLNTWESCVNISKKLDEPTKQLLTNGIPALKALSQSLIDNIRAEKSKSPSQQCYGQMFMRMREQIYRTFAQHCRSVEQIGEVLEAEGNTHIAALSDCLLDARKMGSNIFDVSSAISRSIHRCLKYPLYVGEMLKHTPITHMDHPKLMEALRQLGALASKMNEFKRRKELIRKYQSEQQLSLTERLARINMHSLVKKSNRLKYRIGSSIGLNNVRDSEFDYLISLMDDAERRLCKFLYCAQLYKKTLEIALKRHEDSYKGICPPQEERAVQTLASMFRSMDRIYREHIDVFEKDVINVGKKLVRHECTKLIHKRYDKLADYETAKADNKNQEEIEMRRNEYEALNNQVKSGLPKVISTINKKLVELIQKVHEMDNGFLERMDKWYIEERSQRLKEFAPEAKDFRHFLSMTQKDRFKEMDKLLRFRKGEERPLSTISENNGVKRNSSSFRVNKDKKVSSTNVAKAINQRRPQNPKERDALIKIMKAQHREKDLRRVATPFESSRIVLDVNDIVVINEHRAGCCLCDNGVGIDLIPLNYLRPLDEENYFYVLPPSTSSQALDSPTTTMRTQTSIATPAEVVPPRSSFQQSSLDQLIPISQIITNTQSQKISTSPFFQTPPLQKLLLSSPSPLIATATPSRPSVTTAPIATAIIDQPLPNGQGRDCAYNSNTSVPHNNNNYDKSSSNMVVNGEKDLIDLNEDLIDFNTLV